MISLSVIILTRNRSKLLEKCLDSLINIKKKNWEIIVVDNGSSDETAQVLKQYKKLIIIENKKNLGVGAGRNLGIGKSKGEFIIFLDDDAYVRENPFTKIISFMKSNKSIGIIGPKILYPDGKLQESTRSYPTILPILWRGTFLQQMFPNAPFYKRYLLKDFSHRQIKKVDWLMGACLIVRRGVFDNIGLFDRNFFLVYDDIDFCFRAKKMGWKVVYYPHVKVYHYYARQSAKGFMTRAKLEHLKSILYFFFKTKFLIK